MICHYIVRKCQIGEENEEPITENGHALFCSYIKLFYTVYTSSYSVRVEKSSGDSAGQKVYIKGPMNIENSPHKHKL